MIRTFRRRLILHAYPLLVAAMLIDSALSARDTVPFDRWHDALAWAGAAGMTVSAVRVGSLAARVVAVSLAVSALTGRLAWWLWTVPDGVMLSYAVLVLCVVIASIIQWAWAADFLTLNGDPGSRERDGV